MNARDTTPGLAQGIAERLPTWKLVIFALGQLGWSLASYGVSNLVMYFYMPPDAPGAQRIFPPFIFEGALIGIFTIIGFINFGARAFDAVTNPMIASWSDRSRSRMGRRKYFMAMSFAPFALFSVLVFLPLKHYATIPGPAASWLNTVWLSLTILAFYFFYVMYTAPYNALISELGHNPKERLFISTAIGVTWSLGFAVGSTVYDLQRMFERAGLGSTRAFQTVAGDLRRGVPGPHGAARPRHRRETLCRFHGVQRAHDEVPALLAQEHRTSSASSFRSSSTTSARRSSRWVSSTTSSRCCC